MKTRNGSMVMLLAVIAGMLAIVIGLTGSGWAGAQTEGGAKSPDTQKKTEGTAPGQERPKQEGKIISQLKMKEYREKLDQPATIEFEAGTPLREALSHISERYGLTILVDVEAFKADNSNPDVENNPIKLPRLVGVRLRTALRTILQQLNGDFYARDDVLMVVPRARIESGVVLQQPVDVGFEKRTLSDALKELSDMTGVSVVLDAQKQTDPSMQLTADFRNVPLESAVRVLADMAGMKSVVMENMIYVTSHESAERLKEEMSGKSTQLKTKTEPKGGM